MYTPARAMAMVEYAEYEIEKDHLTGDEALERYQREKALHPDAIITLDDFDCGHWEVHTYRTEREKQIFYRTRLARLFKNVLSGFGR